MKEKILAAIDIGSNAVRLLISTVDEADKNKELKKTAFLRVPLRLGEDVFRNGKISEEKRAHLIDCMTGFFYTMKSYKVTSYRACATSAMRDAKNGQEIVDEIKQKCGINIEIIDGQEEGDIIFEAGGLNNVLDKRLNYIYVDVGGGSTEIVLYSNGEKITSRSFQLGSVRLLLDIVSRKEKEAFKLYLEEIYKNYFPLSIIASGGNINKIHKLLGKRERESINYPELKVFYDTLKGMTYDERMLNYKLKSYRADVIVPALKIFTSICKTCKINEIYVPKVGLADGIVHHLLYSE